MDFRKCLSSAIGYLTLFIIGILVIPAGILWGAIAAVWNLADRIMRRLEQ